LSAFCQRLSAGVGKAKAVTAAARKIAALFYDAMRFGMNCQDLGADVLARELTSAPALASAFGST
jgi:transposase